MNNRIFLAGDSTVARNTIASYPQSGWGQALHLYFAEDIIIRNFAKNGRSSKSFIAEGLLDGILGEISPGDLLLIQFGHNDQKEEEERRTEPWSTYQENLKKYIDGVAEKGAFPVLITPLYRRYFDGDGNLLDRVHFDYPEAVIDLGSKTGVPVIDLCGDSREYLKNLGDVASEHLFAVKATGVRDNTHLVYEGAVVFASMVARRLKGICGTWKPALHWKDYFIQDF